jgi:hypothetical protein
MNEGKYLLGRQLVEYGTHFGNYGIVYFVFRGCRRFSMVDIN